MPLDKITFTEWCIMQQAVLDAVNAENCRIQVSEWSVNLHLFDSDGELCASVPIDEYSLEKIINLYYEWAS